MSAPATSSSPARTYWTAFIGLLFDYYDLYLFVYLERTLAAAFALTPAASDALQFVGLAGVGVGALILGALADRFGRGRMMLAVFGVYVAGIAGLSLAWNFGSLLGFRLLASVALGAEWGISHTYLAERVDRAHYRALFRRCIGEIFRRTEAYDTSWSNAGGGALTLVGNECALPIDCVRVVRVEWDGDGTSLGIKSEPQLDEEESGWRSAAGRPSACCITGRRLLLNATPSGDTAGKLVVRGVGIPAEDEALRYLPVDLQWAPADYLLAKLPVDPANARSAARQQWHEAQWREQRERLLAGVRSRAMRGYGY